MKETVLFKVDEEARRIVKTVKVSKESCAAFRGILENDGRCDDYPSIDDAYNVFGGNCYGGIVRIAIEHMLMMVVGMLEDNKCLSVDGDDAFDRIMSSVFPTMCYEELENEEVGDALMFFNDDAEEVLGAVKGCLTDDKAAVFEKNFLQAVKKSTHPAGEIATGILMFIGSGSDDTENMEAN